MGTGVMLTRWTRSPSSSRITVPGGMITFKPGMLGLVRTSRDVVGDETGTPSAQSIFGIHTVYGRTVVWPGYTYVQTSS